MIENPRGKTRRGSANRRTKRELEELYDKMRTMQSENPNIDLTSLFENEKTEKTRRETHKMAFQNYKKFEFLKAGIMNPRDVATNVEVETENYEPFKHPGIKE